MFRFHCQSFDVSVHERLSHRWNVLHEKVVWSCLQETRWCFCQNPHRLLSVLRVPQRLSHSPTCGHSLCRFSQQFTELQQWNNFELNINSLSVRSVRICSIYWINRYSIHTLASSKFNKHIPCTLDWIQKYFCVTFTESEPVNKPAENIEFEK